MPGKQEALSDLSCGRVKNKPTPTLLAGSPEPCVSCHRQEASTQWLLSRKPSGWEGLDTCAHPLAGGGEKPLGHRPHVHLLKIQLGLQ